MTPLTFALKNLPRQRVDLSPLTPNRLAGKTLQEIAAMGLASGKGWLRVGDLFDLSGENLEEVVIENSCARLDHIGQGMSQGAITVHGDAGAYLGCDMAGGRLVVHGDAGSFAASGMQGGWLHIHGNAGDFLAAALPGNKQGMAGGIVIVEGNAGDRVADHMRRGQVLVAGDAGDYCASRLIAGTVAVLGKLGDSPGYGMKRGTLLLRHAPQCLLPTFNDCGCHDLGFLALLLRSWQALGGRFAAIAPAIRVRRYAGDLANGGKGEILIWV